MAELLIQVKGGSAFLPGDVIVACPDGHPWSPEERTSPSWCVLRLPNVSESEASAFTGPGVVTGEGGIPPVRHFYLDLAEIDPGDDGGRVISRDFDATSLDRLKRLRESKSDSPSPGS